jgi:hemoglobin
LQRLHRRDLDSREEIHNLVVAFYREIAFDDLLGSVFCDVAHVNWSVHIPKLIDYWCRVLLGHPGYDGYLLAPHARVNAISAFRPELFDRWYELFVTEVDDGWHGPMAEKAKRHAARVAATLARRFLDIDWPASEAACGEAASQLTLPRTCSA